MYSTLLFNVPVGVTTSTSPVVAPVGTIALMTVETLTLNSAETPLKVTLVAPVRPVPKIVTVLLLSGTA
jgi:hypothetical protein